MESLNIVFRGHNQVDYCVEPLPPLGTHDVLVRTTKTLISTGTELTCLTRRFEPHSLWDRWVRYPFAPGYSLSGEVLAVGEAIEGLQHGQRVAVRAPHRQYVVTPATSVMPIPDDVSDEAAAWFGLANIAQNGVRRANHALGERVVVIGLGLLGQLVVQYLRLLGARTVIAVDTAEERLALARAHGATDILLLDVRDARPAVLHLTEGAGADVVYDVTGAAPVFAAALSLLRRFGRLLLLGDTGTPSAQSLGGDVLVQGLQIIGAHDSHPPLVATDRDPWSHPEMTRLFFTFLGRGEMRVGDLITHRFAPTDAEQAYTTLRMSRDHAMGVIFDWTQL